MVHGEMADYADYTVMNSVLYLFHHFSSFPGGFTSQPGSKLCLCDIITYKPS